MVAQTEPYHLLIADDDESFRWTLKEIFEPHFETFVAESGEAAIELSHRTRIDIALLDMHMVHLTGLDAVRAIKEIDDVIPCILITSDVSEDLRQEASLADAFSVLRKPVSKSQLVKTVSHAIEFAYKDDDVYGWYNVS